MEGFLGGTATQICALPEGHDPKFLLTDGWLSQGWTSSLPAVPIPRG